MLIHAVDKLESFLRQFPIFPNAFLVGGPADFFVIELADQVNVENFLSGVCIFVEHTLHSYELLNMRLIFSLLVSFKN